MKKELQTKAADQLPATLNLSPEEQRAMYGELGQEHLTIPRITLVETLSPEFKQRMANEGELFVKSINRNLGKGPVEIIALARMHSRIYWKPIKEGGGILCRAVDGKLGVGTPGGSCERCPQRQWQGSNPPPCSLYENFLIVLRQDLQRGEPMVLALSGTSTRLKGLKDFNTLLFANSIQRGRPLFSKSYNINVFKKSSGTNEWHIYLISVGNENQPLPEAEQHQAYELFKGMQGKTVVVEEEDPFGDGQEPA